MGGSYCGVRESLFIERDSIFGSRTDLRSGNYMDARESGKRTDATQPYAE